MTTGSRSCPRLIALSLLLLLAAAPTFAATVVVVPAVPTTADIVRLEVTAADPAGPTTFTRTGNAIRIDVPPPIPIDPVPNTTDTLVLGFLPAGTYTWEVYVNGQFDGSGSFIVVAAQVPALDGPALAALALALVAAGWYFTGRR